MPVEYLLHSVDITEPYVTILKIIQQSKLPGTYFQSKDQLLTFDFSKCKGTRIFTSCEKELRLSRPAEGLQVGKTQWYWSKEMNVLEVITQLRDKS